MGKHVKINAPISTLEAAYQVIEAGIDEIYCGVQIEGMKYVTFNGRPGYCSLKDFDQLKSVVDFAHRLKTQVNFVLNLPFMTDILNILAKPYIKKAARTGIDSFIIAEIGYLLLLQKMKIEIPVHLGSFATIRNNEAIEFYSQFNVTRVIAPPDTRLEELELLARNSCGIEIEAFIHGQGCSNVNGNCNLFHSYRPQKEEFPNDPLWVKQKDLSLVSIGIRNPCMFAYHVKAIGSNLEEDAAILNAFPFCSFCDLPKIVATGVSVLKIEGRCQPIEYQVRTAKEYRTLLDFIESGNLDGYQEYLDKLKASSSELQTICKTGKCFYKEVVTK